MILKEERCVVCVCMSVCVCVIAYSPLGWSLYHHPLMPLKPAKSNQILSLGFLKWTQAARSQHRAVIDSATFDKHHIRVRLLEPHRRMCFHHICSGFIYSSLSASAPRSSLLKADGTSTIRRSFSTKTEREDEQGWKNALQYQNVFRLCSNRDQSSEYQKRKRVSIEVWGRDGSYLIDKFTSLSPFFFNYS